MCIICAMGNDMAKVDVADALLHEFEGARQAMKAATARMLECSRVAPGEQSRRAYDRAHKRMVRLLRQWNAIEHMREARGKHGS